MNIDKKITKLIKDFGSGIRGPSFNKRIIRDFGGLDFKYNGDSLLHLVVAKNYGRSSQEVLSTIDILLNLGIDPNLKNNDGQTFIHKSLENYDALAIQHYFADFNVREKFDVNMRDEEGNTIMHSIMMKTNFAYMNCAYMIFHELISNYNFDSSVKNNEGQTILDCCQFDLPTLMKTGELIFGNYYDSFTREFYEKNINYFSDLIATSDDEERKKSLNKTFINRDVALFIRQNFKSGNDDANALALSDIEKLLKCGCDPNTLICDHSFINEAIVRGHDLDYILKISELAIQYGFAINKMKTSVVSSMLSNRRDIKSIIAIYVFSKYGYDDLANDVKNHNNRNALNLLKDGIPRSDVYDYIRIEGFKIMFNEELEKAKIINQQIRFNDDDINIIFDIIDTFKSPLNLGNDYHFIQLFVNFLQEKYSLNINCIDITRLEFLSTLKEYINSQVNNEIDKTFVKHLGSENHE